MIEREKQLTVERLIRVGRLASPFEKEREEENALNIDDLKLPLLPGEPGYVRKGHFGLYIRHLVQTSGTDSIK